MFLSAQDGDDYEGTISFGFSEWTPARLRRYGLHIPIFLVAGFIVIAIAGDLNDSIELTN